MRGLTESLAKFEAAELASAAEEIAGLRVVVRVVDRDANGLKLLAQAAAALGPSVVLVSASRPALVVAARGSAASTTVGQNTPTTVGQNFSSAFDARALVASLISQFGGKGGGRPELAQAGGLDQDPQAIAAAVAELAARSPFQAGGTP